MIEKRHVQWPVREFSQEQLLALGREGAIFLIPVLMRATGETWDLNLYAFKMRSRQENAPWLRLRAVRGSVIQPCKTDSQSHYLCYWTAKGGRGRAMIGKAAGNLLLEKEAWYRKHNLKHPALQKAHKVRKETP